MMDQTRRLDEVALRKPGFHEGIRVTLGDGQKWALPKRGFVMFPQIGDDGEIHIAGRYYYGMDVDRDCRRATGDDQCSTVERLESMIALAAALLTRNYDLSINHLRDLIAYTPGDERSDAMWIDIIRAIQGIDPYVPPVVEREPSDAALIAPAPAEQPAA